MAKSFELFEIISDSDKLKDLRKEYIGSIEGSVVSKIISSDQRWFYYNNGIYNVEEMMGSSFFEMTLIPLSGYTKFVQDYINFGSLNRLCLKAIKYDGEDYFLLTTGDINKRGRTYSVNPVLRLNEDLYNIEKII